jgi:hypothetical protein
VDTTRSDSTSELMMALEKMVKDIEADNPKFLKRFKEAKMTDMRECIIQQEVAKAF